MRRSCECLKVGDYHPLVIEDNLVVFERVCEKDRLIIALNTSDELKSFTLPNDYKGAKIYFGNIENGNLTVKQNDFSVVKI